jgi:hypothetical protein
MSTDDFLHSQDWVAIRRKAIAYAYRRIGRSSMDRAKELASQAIAQVFEHGGWDPAKEPVLKCICKKIIGNLRNDFTRKANAFELMMNDDVEAQALNVSSGEDLPDEVLDRRRYAKRFKDRLVKRLEVSNEGKPDEVGLLLVTLMMEELDTPLAQERATGLPMEEVRAARRRVFYHADIVAQEMADEIERLENERMTP